MSKKKKIIITSLMILVVAACILSCQWIRDRYVKFIVTADIEGRPIEIKEGLGGGRSYEEYEDGTVKHITSRKSLNDGYAVTEIRMLKDVPVRFWGGTDFLVDGEVVRVNTSVDDFVGKDADPWITHIHISFFYDESGNLQQEVTCDDGIVYEAETSEVNDLEIVPGSDTPINHGKIRHLQIRVRND